MPDDVKTYNVKTNGFLFSFTKKEEINSASLARVNNYSNIHAVCYDSNFGPAFGPGLIIRNNNIYSHSCSGYPGINSIINYDINYLLEYYEIFKVMKK